MRKLLTFLIALGALVFAVISPAGANGMLFLAQSAPPPVSFLRQRQFEYDRRHVFYVHLPKHWYRECKYPL